ncbi:hypothetical protein ASB57_03930 [Bordetella sp. N]|nr:hypothetical protein ASB57_03930 [Bordetella sp. N]
MVDQVSKNDRELHAWAHLSHTAAAEAVREGPLAGMCFGVKDVIDVAGMPTRCGSAASDPREADTDATCVNLLRHAGAIPIGKTVTAEYAFRAPGPTRNPRRLDHTPGGSSSGSAAAVAAGMVPFALGTQTGGSIIRPAAYCGVVGFKPSFGAVARAGLAFTCESLDVIGWTADSVGTASAVADVLLPAGTEAAGASRRSSVVLLPHAADHPLEAQALETLEHAADRLRELGVNVQTAAPWAHAGELARTHELVMYYEIARSLRPVADRHGSALGQEVLDAIKTGLTIPGTDYILARRAQERLRHDWSSLIGAADFVLTPSAPGFAPAGLSNTGSSAFNKNWSLLGWPCLHLPTRLDARGLPLGVQLVAPFERDHALLAAAGQWWPALREN